MLGDAKAKLLVTQTSLLGSLPAGVAQAVCLDSFDWSGSQSGHASDASSPTRQSSLM